MAFPESGFLSADVYNQIFTMHGVTMIFLFVMPFAAAFANYCPVADRRPRCRLPPPERALVLGLALRAIFLNTSWIVGGGGAGWLVLLLTQQRHHLLADQRCRLLRHRPVDHRYRLVGVGGQSGGDVSQHAGSGHEPVPHAGVDLDAPGRSSCWPSPCRSSPWRFCCCCSTASSTRNSSTLKPAPTVAVAAPLLDLRSPRGVHHHPPEFRHHLRGDPGVQPEAHFRLLVHGVLRHRDRFHGLGRVGHHVRVRHRSISVFAFSMATMFIAVPTGVKV